ncbi:NAD(P)-binding domain-containing protein [Actinosynnema sp. NPDC047251]|uniref:NAD-dependent glycerol-3-phosphate dehydrogenase n=1 Tax=Saccharothrix espanaensis (strain ATCC 51144 / DSM 44229 / JCM 9112 / NBRC 15066 / NRRL 15764) TaxID=1179773 RepID=K0K6B5_SACES|nr:NAD(P)-binding domain-containing protein [Saccharothrix espanaensis]AUD39513.1 WHU imine reductase 28 [synthetic construct]CCH32444.1 NAD-dependent glycerol-3-phosphate dehydrogenase [Saccharothrix espanaensis DSM 44229]
MNDETTTPVAVIGLGLMGQALAGALLEAGHPTTVWNRTATKADQLVAAGARLAPTVGDALQAASLTIICVTDYQAVHELFDASDVKPAGTTLVNLTSGDSAQARAAAQWAEQRGARYLDGAIMAIPSAIGTAEAVILHSGPQSDFEAHKSTLDALGTVTYLGADHGLASLYDVAGLAMMWSVLNGWLQGTALLRTAGVDAATYTPFARQIAAVVTEWLPGYAEQIDSGSFPAEVSALETDVRAMAHLIEESEAVGVNADLPKLIKAMADRAIAAGHGAEQYPVLIEEFGTPRDD